MIITIDGPTASGKSTTGRLLAKRLGYYYLYSGILYRALAYLLVNFGGYTEENIYKPKSIDIATYLDPQRFIYEYDEQYKERVLFDGQDITPHLKNSFMDKLSSILSMNEEVRIRLNQLQREIAKQGHIIVDGRDAGSVVFPEADAKIFLTASVSVRAARWLEKQERQGMAFTFEQARNVISERDARDTQRAIAPMVIPKDAIVIDNSDITTQDTLQKIIECIKQ